VIGRPQEFQDVDRGVGIRAQRIPQIRIEIPSTLNCSQSDQDFFATADMFPDPAPSPGA